MDSTGGDSSRRKQAEEGSGKRSDMEAKEKEAKEQKEKMREELVQNSTKLISEMMKRKAEMQLEVRAKKRIVLEEGLSEKMKTVKRKSSGTISAGGRKLAKKNSFNKMKNTKMDGGSVKLMAQKSEVRPQGKKNPMQQLLTDRSDIFEVLDHHADDDKDEIDMGKSAMEARLDADEGTMDLKTTKVKSEKFFVQPADPSATDSVTRLEQYSVQDDLDHGSGKSATPLAKKMADQPHNFEVLDHNGDDEKDEIDMDKSAMEACLDADEGTMDLKTIKVRSEKFLVQPADPSATDSVTRLEQYSVQHDLDHGSGKSATPLAKKMAEDEMAEEAESFSSYREGWDCSWSRTCGFFKDITVLSSMLFTHYTPGLIPLGSAGSTPKTLQILSLKLTEIAGGLELPLSVYGVVAARDIVDHNRNILFYCNKNHAQKLKQNDTFLHLMGPSRAIVFNEDVDFEIQLLLEGTPEGTPLICCARKYKKRYGSGVSTICFKNSFCNLELCLQPVEQTVQATILGVKVAKENGSWPLKYGGIVACYPLSGEIVFTDGRFSRSINTSSSKIVLLDSKYGAMPEGSGGYVHLLRQVVSVELEGGLDVAIQAYTESGGAAAESRVHFTAQKSNISQLECYLDGAKVTITVAWSLVPTDKMDVELGVGGMWVA